MANQFDELIATREHLRSLYKQPSERAHNETLVAHAVPSQTVAEVEAAISDHNTRLY